MRGIQTVQSIPAVLPQSNIDTDQILPKQFLTGVDKVGYGKHLFHDWRYLDNEERTPNPEFVLNQAPFHQTSILVVGENFGCGSSREHAPWAIKDFGVHAIISSSLADIFFNNCINNAIVPVALEQNCFSELMQSLQDDPMQTVKVDVRKLCINFGQNVCSFELTGYQQKALLEGFDEIDQSMMFELNISDFERRHNALSLR